MSGSLGGLGFLLLFCTSRASLQIFKESFAAVSSVSPRLVRLALLHLNKPLTWRSHLSFLVFFIIMARTQTPNRQGAMNDINQHSGFPQLSNEAGCARREKRTESK